MIDQSEVERRVQLIRRRCSAAEALVGIDVDRFASDPHLASSAERQLHLATEACIELGMLLIKGLKLPQPTSFDQIGDILVEAGMGSPEQSGLAFERITRLRTLLVHDFVGIDPRLLHEQLRPRVMDVEAFANQATLFARRMA